MRIMDIGRVNSNNNSLLYSISLYRIYSRVKYNKYNKNNRVRIKIIIILQFKDKFRCRRKKSNFLWKGLLIMMRMLLLRSIQRILQWLRITILISLFRILLIISQ
jgi:hypothetical protein